MFDIIRKAEYFAWWDAQIADHKAWHLKAIQDAWVLAELRGARGLRICEVGGGDTRLLPRLSEHNECWNVDRFDGNGNGPQQLMKKAGIRSVQARLGAFDPQLPEGYFDVVCSVSVVEHVADEEMLDFFRDCARVLRPGGRMLHAIDVYITDEAAEIARVELYRAAAAQSGCGLVFEHTPSLPRLIGFRCDMASNSDGQVAAWNRSAPAGRARRETHQVVTLKGSWIKPAA